ncbi:MAG TPA: hypothetical protein PK055_00125 [Gammaproteobacteria bacterium]|jgi:hypothetical protein|nr:hypothetical protein [Xanthomonadales bacterium]HOP21643.1 hypothetical protein [Gammaproteobacteria bacterium]HPI94593.1 hypothetical protein [Gammaproteobacteria bacterium]HPQ86038.1 hypothetical protein [Gammaproteobacteria bacterium]
MRTAAGVILIIAAVFNLVAGLTWLGGGALTQGVSTGMSQVATQMEKESGSQMTAEQKAQMEKFQDEVGGSGIGFMAFGVFLLVSVGILIAGAVFLFQNKKAQFIMIAGGIAVLAEVLGSLMSSFGVTNIIGLVGGVMAILAAKSMGTGPAPEPAE